MHPRHESTACPQGGSDVITRTALKRINWANYKINQTSDKVGVFVSIVSTKIPYKGAGKEYIGASPCTDPVSCHRTTHSVLDAQAYHFSP